VKGISLSIPRGSIVGLVGESGCGKSMTARSINNILPPLAKVTDGSILWHDMSGEVTDLVSLKEKEIRKRCGTDIAMIYQ
ncbi:MAG: ATP-binding cassette domain-containing protein, partial [Lachnospiraceae bacterium]|nr:ATP-binding cassette domain-containing protein [Lachnospiraceae bacterium]